MNKLFTRIAKALLGLSMALGVGTAIGSNTNNVLNVNASAGETHTLFDVSTSSNWETSSSNYSNTWTSNNCVFTGGANNNKGWAYVRLGGKSLTNADRTIGTTVATTYPTSSVDITVVTLKSNSNLVINSVTFKVWGSYNSETKVFSSEVDSISLTNSYAATTLTVEPSSDDYWDTGVYFQLVVNVTNSKTSNYGTDISKLIATEADTGGGGGDDPTPLGTPKPEYDSVNNKVTWVAIPNASSYQVSVGDESHYSTSTSPYDGNFAVGTQYTVYVKAISGSESYSDSPAGSVTFTVPTPTTYSVTYNSNNTAAQTSVDENEYLSNESATVLSNSFTPESGKEFHHWNTANDNTGTTYFPGGSLTVSADTTLYAIWANSVSGNGSVVFNDNSTDSTTETTSADALWNYLSSGQGYVSSFSSLSKVYKGKSGVKLGTGSATGSFTINISSSKSSGLNGKVLWASLERYGTDTGNVEFTSSSINSGSKVEVNYTDLDASKFTEVEIGTFASAPSSLTIGTSNKRVYIKSIRFADAPTEYTVTYDTNGGNEIAASDVTIGQSLALPTPTRTDYHFLGWKVLSGETPTGDYLESPYTPTGNVTIQAQWTSDVLHVTYNANGGENAPTDSTVYHYNESVPVASVESMTKTHNTFNGWNDKADGSGNNYSAGGTFNITEDITLYAKWTVNAVTSLVNVNNSAPTKTTYDAGDAFEPTGLVIHAVYQNEGEDNTNIASLISWGDLVYQATSVTGTYGGQSITITGLTINAAAGTEDKPYTSSQAVVAVLDYGSTSASSGTFYAFGYVKKIYNKNLWIVDDPDLIGAENEPEDSACLQCYASSNWTNVAVGDLITVSGKKQVYNNIAEFSSSVITNKVAETITLNKTVSNDALTINSPFSYSGVVSIDYTHKTDVANANALVTFSGYNMTSVGNQTVTISYTDEKLNKTATSLTYTLTVSYAAVSSVTINGNSTINMTQASEHEFTYTTNENIDPSSTVVWNAVNADGSSIPSGDFDIDDGVLTVTTSSTGRLLVSVTVGGVTSNVITVNVTGNPVPTLDSSNLYGFIGKQGTLEASVDGGTAPYTYKWTITGNSGVASINAEYGDDGSDAVIDYDGRGQTVVTLTVTDANSKTGTVTANVYVTETLTEIKASSSSEEHETYTVSAQSYSNGDAVSSYSGTNFALAFSKGSGSNPPAYYTKSPSGVRVYGGGEITVSSTTQTLTKIVITASNSTKTISADVGEIDGYQWEGSSSSVVLSVESGSGNLAVTSITVYWTETTEGEVITETNYFAQNAAIEFAESLTTKLNQVCDTNGGTNTSSLASKWTEIKGVYDSKVTALTAHDTSASDNALETFKLLIKCAAPSDANNADKLQKALCSYNYVYAKYYQVLDAEGVGGDFLTDTGKANVSHSARVTPISIFGITQNTNTVAIIVIISMVSVTAIGGYFFLRKRKEN